MKKTLACILTLTILMAGTMALAEQPLTLGGDGGTAAVSVPYTASETTSVTIDWTAPVAFTFAWNGTAWTAAAKTQDLTFTVTNKSTANKTVTISPTDTGKSNWLSAAAKENKSSVTLYPVKGGADQLKEDTIVYTLTAADVSALDGLSTAENQSGTINFSVTVANATPQS